MIKLILKFIEFDNVILSKNALKKLYKIYKCLNNLQFQLQLFFFVFYVSKNIQRLKMLC